MKEIDLLAEIRTWRDEFARSHDYDLAAIAAAVREADATVAERLVSGGWQVGGRRGHLGCQCGKHLDRPRPV